MNPQQAARQRAAKTRRQRSQEALVDAARQRFAELGWQATRVEDIAKIANVSTATAFSYFTKHSLIGYAYVPLFQAIADHAAADISHARDPVRALQRHVHELAAVSRDHRNLSEALLAAIQEQAMKSGGPPDPPDDPNDVRVIVPMPAPMAELIEYGQRRGVLETTAPASDIASYHTNALFLLLFTRPHTPADDIATIVLSQLLPGVHARSAPGETRDDPEH